MFKKTQIFYDVFTSRFGYGRGFWTLLVGIVTAFALLMQIESRRPHPIVERIPASEFTSRNSQN